MQQNARLIADTDTAIEKISAEVQEMCELFASLGSLVEAQAQPIETIQDAAHRAAEKTAAAAAGDTAAAPPPDEACAGNPFRAGEGVALRGPN